MSLPKRLLGLLAPGTRPKRRDAIGQIVGQIGEQRNLVLVERIWRLGIEVQGSQGLSIDPEWERNGRSVAAFCCLVAPRRECWIRSDTTRDTKLSGPYRGPSGAAPPLGVGPRDSQGVKVSFFISALGHRAYVFALVLLGKTNPS